MKERGIALPWDLDEVVDARRRTSSPGERGGAAQVGEAVDPRRRAMDSAARMPRSRPASTSRATSTPSAAAWTATRRSARTWAGCSTCRRPRRDGASTPSTSSCAGCDGDDVPSTHREDVAARTLSRVPSRAWHPRTQPHRRPHRLRPPLRGARASGAGCGCASAPRRCRRPDADRLRAGRLHGAAREAHRCEAHPRDRDVHRLLLDGRWRWPCRRTGGSPAAT